MGPREPITLLPHTSQRSNQELYFQILHGSSFPGFRFVGFGPLMSIDERRPRDRPLFAPDDVRELSEGKLACAFVEL